MGNEQNEILSIVRNGFFSEGIYCIPEESLKSNIANTITETASELEKEKIAAAESVITLVEEPEIEVIEPEVEQKTVETATKSDSLAPLKIEEKDLKSEPENPVEFSGENKKGVAIIVNYPDDRWIHFKDRIILDRILASVKLTFDDVALINTHYYKPVSVNELYEKFSITKLIGFGIKDQFLSGMKREKPEKTDYVSVFLMNSTLDEIAMDQIKKRILWNHIKLMFNLG